MEPYLYILAGGNGAGKSTFYRLFLEKQGFVFVNADVIAKRLDPEEPLRASKAAQQLADNLRDQKIRVKESFCYETVFSHESKLQVIEDAQNQGFRVFLIYIYLAVEDLHVYRVLQRTTEGGHDVPEEKIRQRVGRLPGLITKAFLIADEVLIFDNSGSGTDGYRLVARKTERDAEMSVLSPLPCWLKL